MKPVRILVLEDNPSDALLVQSLLAREKSFNHLLTREKRLKDGLARVAKQTFDIALVDLGLPDSRNLETFVALRKVAPRLPVIVMTGGDDLETALAAIKLGAQDYLLKGEMTGFILSRAIRYAIEREQRESEREKLVADLQKALTQVKNLSGLLPICGSCKRIRDDRGYWDQIESYIVEHTQAKFSHGICPECATKELEAKGIAVPERIRAAAGKQKKPRS